MRDTILSKSGLPRSRSASGPDFLCIGQQKAGTGWLYDMLEFEPDFWMPPVKEFKFFNNNFPLRRMRRKFPKDMANQLGELNRKRRKKRRRLLDERDVAFARHALTYKKKGKGSIDWYKKLFAPKEGLVSGDISPAYSALDSDIIAAIAGAMPDLRILLLLRDPVSRAWSHFNMNQRLEVIGYHHSFAEPSEEAVTAFQRPTSAGEVADFLRQDKVRRRSFPSVIYGNWSRHFDPSRISVVFFEDITKNPEAVVKSIREDLGLPGSVPAEARASVDFNRKATQLKRQMTEEARAFLVETFREEMLRSAELFGGPAEQWPRRYGIA